ncbi:MAG: 1-acyl-sn-glycerol-3-phosphate acyltransferase [Anaerolineales bacterium]|jgi:1-acyl-sn-glycerol-3-phosphate acyltransferase|nr:1-acyl-sn-glycerol-3-phosphate acyltransferase [Chloroflexota bacterium]MBK6644474.1 1-acyl-sn-glycerol-3-phosphate acyltransferase [Anaerolineales bacterium]MCC6985592.1 1-acyl-sn-glycerol-3-phosphate acyltransferase [Anaerolineales bacterium]
MKTIIVGIIRLVIRLVARVEIQGYENIPPKGGFVLAVNHLGFLDAPLAYYALNNWNLFIPVAEKWADYAILRWMGKHLNAIFVDRFNPDLKSMREMMKRMEEGQTLVIAPEGTRARDEKMAQGKPGVAYLAARSGWTILPVAISGTEDRLVLANLKRFKRATIRLTAGKTFTLPPLPKENRDEKLQEYTDEIMCRIAAMLPEHSRGFYAEHPRLKELLSANQ